MRASSSSNIWSLHKDREQKECADLSFPHRQVDTRGLSSQGCNALPDGPDMENAGVATQIRIPLWKRAFDLAVILFTLPVWLPLVALISLMIKAVSKGPVLFRQQRIGLGGVPFMILKFRSMKVNTDTQCHEEHLDRLIKSDHPMTKLDVAGDLRVIPGGKWFRASALDELPQLLNVIRGEMSLVGPRPCTPHEFDRYQPRQKRDRTKILPGLTGYWQVNGKNQTTFSEMIAMDLAYGENMSLWLDLAIMARTIPVIFQQLLEARARKRNESRNRVREQMSARDAVKQAI